MKSLNISEVHGAHKNISDLEVFGDVEGGCIVQVTTQQTNPDGSYAVAEALTYVPGVHLDKEVEPRRLVPIR